MDPPLREPTFLILTALATGPRHGYTIIAEVSALSGGRLELRPGTLYGALDRLSDDGLVELDAEKTVNGRRRRYYRLTDAGDAMLRAETARLRANAEAATARLRIRDAGAPGKLAEGFARAASARLVEGFAAAVVRPAGGIA
jgi:DNA-binding PadR family transcriptional regulator